MPFLRKAFGVENQITFVLTQIAARILRDSDLHKVDEAILENTWNLWDWVAEFNLHEKKISLDQLSEIYRLIRRSPKDPTYMYQKEDLTIGRQAETLYARLSSIFRPHLSVAFLPESYESNIWPVTGKTIRGVEVQKNFGSDFSLQILESFEGLEFGHVDPKELEFLALILANTFIDVLKLTNSMDRKERLSRRALAFEILPIIPCFLLARHIP